MKIKNKSGSRVNSCNIPVFIVWRFDSILHAYTYCLRNFNIINISMHYKCISSVRGIIQGAIS